MIKKIERILYYDKFWLSPYPHGVSIGIQAAAAAITLTFPYTNETLHNIVLLANAIGMAVAIKGLVSYFKWKRARENRLAEMYADAHKVLEKVSPLLDELFERELGKGLENMDHHALMRAQVEAQAIIEKGFDDLDKSRSSQSTPDKT
jgi:hypothetical protein